MKKFITALILLYFGTNLLSAQQNLVSNGKFEEIIIPDTCYVGQLPFADYSPPITQHQVKDWWIPIIYQSFYLRSCDTDTTVLITHHPVYGVPDNEFGSAEDPDSGHAYACLNTWYLSDTLTTFSSIETHLNEPLKKNHHYLFKLLARPGYFYSLRTNINFCLEKDSIFDAALSYYTPSRADYVFSSDSIIVDCRYWHEVKINFYVDTDSLKYLVIGTFPTVRSNRHLDVNGVDSCGNLSILHDVSFMYVDNVQLYDLDTQIGINEIDAEFKSIRISPNPAQNKIHVQTPAFVNAFMWNLYDLQGRLIQTYSITHKEEQITLPENMAAGMYYWKLVPAEPLGAERAGVFLNCGKLLKE
jgi:hypothetical protein